MDITALTNAITLLRTETQERSISPERVGSLLQQLANLIKTADESGTPQQQIDEIVSNAIKNITVSASSNASAVTVVMTLTGLDGETSTKSFTIPVATDTKAGVISAADLNTILTAIARIGTGAGITSEELAKFNKVASHFVRIGTESTFWVTTHDAEAEAAKLEYCANPDIFILYYYVKGSLFGFIEQYLNGVTCTQTIHWSGTVKKRIITFTDDTRTEIGEVGEWTELAVMTAEEVLALATKNELSTIEGRNSFGIKFLGHVGDSSSTGEAAAAELAIVSDTKIKWVVYTYSSYTAMIHQTHNANTTVQNMFFAGSRQSRRTITFTDQTRTEIASVGSWATIGTDIGINRSGTTATFKIVQPLLDNTTGLLTLVLGQANTSKAGLMTAANVQLLNQIDSDVTDMKVDIETLQSDIQQIRQIIAGLADIYVKKPKLYVTLAPSTIEIPVNQGSSSGGTIASNVAQRIDIEAMDENENVIPMSDCQVTWTWSTSHEESAFTMEHEMEKSYMTLYADQGDEWAGNTAGKCFVTVTYGNLSTVAEITLTRSEV